MTTSFSIRDCVGAALHVARTQWRALLIASAIGAAATAAAAAVSMTSPGLALVGGVLTWIIQSFVYALFTRAALGGAPAIEPREGLRLFSAMLIVGFFLFLVFFVLMIPGVVVLLSGPMRPYIPEMQHAGQNQAAMMEIVQRFAQANPAPLLAFFGFYAILWLLLTSRLYVAAPATVDAKRILTFETWVWTKGQTLRILGARIMLLAPAFILMAALAYLVARPFGVDLETGGAAQAASPGFVVYLALDRLIYFAVYAVLEAGLSAAIYRALRPAARATA